MTWNAAFPPSSSPLRRSPLNPNQDDLFPRRRLPPPAAFPSSNDTMSQQTQSDPINIEHNHQPASVKLRKSSVPPLDLSHRLQPSPSPRPANNRTSPLSPRWTGSRSEDAEPTGSPSRSVSGGRLAARPLRSVSGGSMSGSGASPTPNFGSLLGSYEESLLAGRMSAAPSRLLIFDADLGVLGLGRCPSSLKCPPHLSLSFPACFYGGQGGSTEATASLGTPYVGTIDLEGHYWDQLLASDPQTIPVDLATARATAAPPHTPSFPGYRVPPKGQLQLIIKIPSSTAVKVFLVPYDLASMPAGSKTFIRQKILVTAPMRGAEAVSINQSPSARSPSSPQSPRCSAATPSTRETLRYAIQLQFCAPPLPTPSARSNQFGQKKTSADNDPSSRASGGATPRIYLHKSIRVVFAARAPDSSEKLHVVTEAIGGLGAAGAVPPEKTSGRQMYATYSGPPADWTEARDGIKERIRAARSRDRKMVRPIDADAGSHGMHAEPECTIDMPNSDPNGERWEQKHEELMETLCGPDALGSSWEDSTWEKESTGGSLPQDMAIGSSQTGALRRSNLAGERGLDHQTGSHPQSQEQPLLDAWPPILRREYGSQAVVRPGGLTRILSDPNVTSPSLSPTDSTQHAQRASPPSSRSLSPQHSSGSIRIASPLHARNPSRPTSPTLTALTSTTTALGHISSRSSSPSLDQQLGSYELPPPTSAHLSMTRTLSSSSSNSIVAPSKPSSPSISPTIGRSRSSTTTSSGGGGGTSLLIKRLEDLNLGDVEEREEVSRASFLGRVPARRSHSAQPPQKKL